MKNFILLFTILFACIQLNAQSSKYPSGTKEDAVSLKNYEIKLQSSYKGAKNPNTELSIFRKINHLSS